METIEICGVRARVARSFAERAKGLIGTKDLPDGERELGYLVCVYDDVDADHIERMLRADGLYRYTFIGHGDGVARINTYPGSEMVAPRERFTKYGIASLVLKACGSAAIDDGGYHHKKRHVRINDWELNVARNGVFIGYEGPVVLLNEHIEWRMRKGANYGEQVSR